MNLEKSRGLAGFCIDLNISSFPFSLLRYRAFYWELLGSEADALVAEALLNCWLYGSGTVQRVSGWSTSAGSSAAITVGNDGVFPEGKVEAIKVSLHSSSKVHSHCHQKPPFPICQVRFLSQLQAFKLSELNSIIQIA